LKILILFIVCFSISNVKADINKDAAQQFYRFYEVYDSILKTKNTYKLKLETVFFSTKSSELSKTNIELILQRNENDSLVGYSYFSKYDDILYINHNYINYQIDLKNKNFIKKTKFKKLNDIGHFFTSLNTFFVPYNKLNLYDSFLDTNYYNIKILQNNETHTTFLSQDINLKNSFVFNYKFKFNNKSKLLEKIEIITDFMGNGSYSVNNIKSFELTNEENESYFDVSEYLENYGEYRYFSYKGFVCKKPGEEIIGNIIYDTNLDEFKGHKIVSFNNLNNEVNKNLTKELSELSNNFKIDYINYEFKDSTLTVIKKNKKEEISLNNLTQYGVDVSPCIYILDENNKVVDYLKGFGKESKNLLIEKLSNINK